MVRRFRFLIPLGLGIGLLLATWAETSHAQAPRRPTTPNLTPQAAPPAATQAPAAPQAPAATETPAATEIPEGETPTADSPATTSEGQTTEPARPQSPFNDPDNRLRSLRGRLLGEGFGGGRPGGRGDGNAPTPPARIGGVHPIMLDMVLSNTTLQEELTLTEAQKAEIEKLSAESRQRRDDLTRQMRERREEGEGRSRDQGSQFAQIGNQAQTELAKILTEEQRTRLVEIEMRVVGLIGIVSQEEILRKLNPTPTQVHQFRMILEQLRTAQSQSRQVMRDRMAAAFGNRGRGDQGGRGGQAGQTGQFPGGGQFPGNNPPFTIQGQINGQPIQGGGQFPGGQGAQGGFGGNFGQNQPGGRNFGQFPGGPGGPAGRFGGQQPGAGNAQGAQPRPSREQIAAQMQQVTEQEEKIRQEAERAIAKQLTSGQRSKVNDLIGEPVDLAKLLESSGGPGGRGGFGGDPRGGRGGNR